MRLSSSHRLHLIFSRISNVPGAQSWVSYLCNLLPACPLLCPLHLPLALEHPSAHGSPYDPFCNSESLPRYRNSTLSSFCRVKSALQPSSSYLTLHPSLLHRFLAFVSSPLLHHQPPRRQANSALYPYTHHTTARTAHIWPLLPSPHTP